MLVRAKVGFIGSSAPSSSHHESFKAFIHKEIDFTFVQEEGAGGSRYDARGKVDSLIGQATKLAEKHGWDGVIISGGPREVLNPGFSARLSAALKVPVATALSSSTAALKMFAVRRVLLMTPVDDKLKELYRDFLGEFGIQACLSPTNTARSHRRPKA